MYKGKELTADEVLSPLAENFIVEKCLFKIDERLPNHVKNTRGHLFTEARPTLKGYYSHRLIQCLRSSTIKNQDQVRCQLAKSEVVVHHFQINNEVHIIINSFKGSQHLLDLQIDLQFGEL